MWLDFFSLFFLHHTLLINQIKSSIKLLQVKLTLILFTHNQILFVKNTSVITIYLSTIENIFYVITSSLIFIVITISKCIIVFSGQFAIASKTNSDKKKMQFLKMQYLEV